MNHFHIHKEQSEDKNEGKNLFAIPTQKIKYLEINLAVNVKVVYEENFTTFLKDLK